MKDKLILQIKGVSKKFPGTKALTDVNLSIRKGEIHAIVGENGAGKSTLMNIISGVYKPDEGEIYFLDRKVSYDNPMEAQNDGIGFVHQELSLCQHISVAENIFIGRLPIGFGKIIKQKKLYKMAKEQINEFETNINPSSITSNLNIAQQQIIEISKSLALNCKLLILDEPKV